ncbi:transcription initiation factor TFIID subunit 4B-like [Acanthochromis polyacanthus]|uniref:transcription initiation factor TFIID subunit 4B-like n=1 Tax=Acanthochromis polyacanthus TaxID=80966 RepID=UPI00223479D9|nr:transcription initiation factor TFIID subunit 4B-like [Acanthochromis polyacanthus]
MVIAVPRSATPQPVAPRPPQTASAQLPANIQIPSGMMLIRSDSGQLMLVSQQALTQAHQGPRAVIGVAPKPAVVQTLSAVSERGSHPRIQVAITEPKKDPPATFSQETLESVKKCKNFLVTLIKLASSDSRSANMANNVRGLVKSLLEGKVEAEEFTEQLYDELKSTPQPCLVPFLKKSLPAVRCLTADPQLFIQQASTSIRNPTSLSSTVKPSSTDLRTSQQGVQQAQGVTLRPGLTTFAQSRHYVYKRGGPVLRHTVVQSGKHFADDDINDVAYMAGVNLREENAQILTTMVGSVVQSCQDQLFLSPHPVLSRILHTGQALGVTDVGPEVVALVSHATQECLRGLLEKLTVIAEHRKAALKEDQWYIKESDVRSQLRFLEEIESLKKKRKDEEERERLLRLARSRSHTEDPQHQQLRQRAKELQQIEEAQLQQREANLHALAAIGPRKKRPVDVIESQVVPPSTVPLLPRQGVHRVTRVMLKDLLACMEQDRFLRHSLTLYKAML